MSKKKEKHNISFLKIININSENKENINKIRKKWEFIKYLIINYQPIHLNENNEIIKREERNTKKKQNE